MVEYVFSLDDLARVDEAFYVLEGRLTFRYDDEDIPAGPGTYLFMPGGVPHTFVVGGGTAGLTALLDLPSHDRVHLGLDCGDEKSAFPARDPVE